MNKRQKIYNKYDGKCAYSGTDLDPDWQIDHVIPRRYFAITGDEGCDDIDNLMPAQGIINHYKRELDLEGFRKYMMTFHLRLAKLPKNPKVSRSIRRKEYMYKVADYFGITPEKPFSGTFYFETLKQ